MARITTYALDSAINDNDKLIGTDADNNNQTKNFSLVGIADYVIDKLIDPDATDFHIPVFNQNGLRITDSIMHQDSSVSNGTAGTLITIDGSLLVNNNATVYLNLSVAGESYLLGNVYLGTTPADSIKQKGTLELLAPVKDSTGTLGSSEQVLVSNASGVLSWENYQGTGLEFQSSWNADTNVPDLTAIPLDGDNTGKYWVCSVEGTTDLSGITQWSPGDWAIISQDNNDNVFWSKVDNSSVDGLGETDKLTYWDSPKTLTFASNIVVTDNGLTLGSNTGSAQNGTINLNGDAPRITIGNGFEFSHSLNGIAEISETGTGDLHIYSDNEVQIKSGLAGETFAKFRKDGPIELYYDNVKRFSTQNYGAEVLGKLYVEGNTEVNTNLTVQGASDFYGAATFEEVVNFQNSVFDETSTPGTAGQVLSTTGSAVRWVDPSTGYVTGTGTNLTVPMWYGASPTNNLNDSSLSFRIVDPGNLNDYGMQFGGFSLATGQRNSIAMGYDNRATAEATLATGHGTIASGKHAASFNFTTLATGEKSAAFGVASEASGKNSFAIGAYTTAATSNSFAGGLNATANPSLNGATAFAYGNALNITGEDAAGFGKGNTATGRRNFVAGSNNQVGGDNSFAVGALNVISAGGSVAIGSGHNITTFGGFAIGQNHTINSGIQTAAFGYNLSTGSQQYQVVVGRYNEVNNDADFVVGTGGTSGSRKNGLEVYNNKVVIPEYGSGTVTAVTPAFNIQVDAAGKLIETAAVAPLFARTVILISQTGTTPPVVNANLENGLNLPTEPFLWTRLASGEYNLEGTGAFDVNKTIVFLNGGSAENNHDIAWEVIDSDNLVIRTHNGDGRLTKASLEIRTYN
jgi:hypothetical protein